MDQPRASSRFLDYLLAAIASWVWIGTLHLVREWH
jgi:hypothetical protein